MMQKHGLKKAPHVKDMHLHPEGSKTLEHTGDVLEAKGWMVKQHVEKKKLV